MEAGIIRGDGSAPTGIGDIIDLSHGQVWPFIFDYWDGDFDRGLMAVGMGPAVQTSYRKPLAGFTRPARGFCSNKKNRNQF